MTRAFLTFLLVYGLVYFFIIVFQCLPVQAIWDRSINGRCLDLLAISYTGATGAILQDVILVIMPIPELMKLQLSRKKRLSLVFIFGLGSFATLASILRLKYLVFFSHSYDPTWDNFYVVLWSGIEVNAAITCGSLPAILPLLKKLFSDEKRLSFKMSGRSNT
ncbi:hypothetical protein EsH8_V_001194 [Colletotrichum jinshuiense]